MPHNLNKSENPIFGSETHEGVSLRDHVAALLFKDAQAVKVGATGKELQDAFVKAQLAYQLADLFIKARQM